MHICYALQPHAKSIFLAGPTPRVAEVASWRPQALALLADDFHFEGTVFVPETEDGQPHDEYDHQIHWEWEGLNQATVVVFWVPRELETLPAFTTNVEFGLLAASGKLVLGFPRGAPKMRYLEALAERYHIPVFDTLFDTLAEAVHKTKGAFGSPA